MVDKQTAPLLSTTYFTHHRHHAKIGNINQQPSLTLLHRITQLSAFPLLARPVTLGVRLSMTAIPRAQPGGNFVACHYDFWYIITECEQALSGDKGAGCGCECCATAVSDGG